jgi:hypothetical protein
MYNKHNGDKARTILMHAKELVEHYVNSSSKLLIMTSINYPMLKF